MANNTSVSSFSNYSISPMASNALPNDFQSYITVKTEIDQSFSPNRHHFCNQITSQSLHGSPHHFSSCMYAATVSPSILASGSPDRCASVVSAKENTGFRGVPSCRRRLDFNHNAFLDVTKVGPVAVAKRNERERNRVKLINMTFQTLRQHLPLGASGVKGKSRKLSKVQTLRSAIEYIRQLQDLVHNRQQHHQMEHHSKTEDSGSSMLLGNEDMKNPYHADDINTILSSKRDNVKGYLQCEKRCGGSESTAAAQETEVVICSSTTNSNSESPYSSASSYEAVTTPEDEEFIDFDDWF